MKNYTTKKKLNLAHMFYSGSPFCSALPSQLLRLPNTLNLSRVIPDSKSGVEAALMKLRRPGCHNFLVVFNVSLFVLGRYTHHGLNMWHPDFMKSG